MALSVNHRAIRWLRAQLPELVAGGVISSDSAGAIDRHYQASEARATSFGFVILAVIGSALMGAGIILLIAHNWDELSRPTRCLLAFLPLVLAQLLGFFVLLRRNDSPAWRESAAIFDVAAIAIAISLVSQTYQIQGSFTDFMRIWLLLGIPIIYLFRTNFGALAYIIGSAVWMLSKGNWSFNRPGEMFFWLLLLLVVPFYVKVVRQSSSVWAFRVLSIALIAVSAVGLGVTIEFTRSDLGGVAFAGFFAVIYLSGMIWQGGAKESLNVLSVMGGLGVAITAVALSFEALWHLHPSWESPSLEQAAGIGIALCFPIAAVALSAWSWVRRTIPFSISAASIPVVAGIARLVAGAASPAARPFDNPYAFAAAVLFNLYALVLGIEFLMRGIKAGSMARANFGLLVIAALALARFFDSDLSFVARGVGFIAVGAGFLIANVIFFRKRIHA